MRMIGNWVILFLSYIFAIAEAGSQPEVHRIPCIVNCRTATSSQLANISLRIYTGKTLEEYTSVLVGNSTRLIDHIDGRKPTVIYISGWTEDPASPSVELILQAYLDRGDHNVLLVDYTEIANFEYLDALSSAPAVGSTLAQALNDLVTAGWDPTTLHIVSHSLGSQIAGFMGRQTKFSIPRITGLDPAGPGFNWLVSPLDWKDADFVDVILTDAGLYGINSIDVHAVFYPNGGVRVQPGCPRFALPLSLEAFCSHHRSWNFYAESLRKENAFVGVKCNSYVLFKIGLCPSNEAILMGYGTPTSARGKIYLQTNEAQPFGRGEEGSRYTR